MGLSLFSFLLLAPQTVSVPAQTEFAEEIVVIGERLKKWTGKYKIRGEKIRCATKQSSGDREIDFIGCAAFRICATQLKSRIAASDSKSLDKQTRKGMKISIKTDLTACVIDQRQDLIANLAGRRVQKN